MAQPTIDRLAAQAALVQTSIEGLIARAQTQNLDRAEIMAQFTTLQRQFDDLRDEVVQAPLLKYFVLAPTGDGPPPAGGLEEIPLLLSTRELPAMEAEARAAEREDGAELPTAQVDAHNALVDDVLATLSAPRPAQASPRSVKRRKGDAGGPAAGTVATRWPVDL